MDRVSQERAREAIHSLHVAASRGKLDCPSYADEAKALYSFIDQSGEVVAEPVAWQYQVNTPVDFWSGKREWGDWRNCTPEWAEKYGSKDKHIRTRPLYPHPPLSAGMEELEWVLNPQNDFCTYQVNLFFNGKRIGMVEDFHNGKWHAYLLIYDKLAANEFDSEDAAKKGLTSLVREWLNLPSPAKEVG